MGETVKREVGYPMNYAKLYAIVCGAASEAVELMDAGDIAGARACLLAALEEAEELYIRGAAAEIPPGGEEPVIIRLYEKEK